MDSTLKVLTYNIHKGRTPSSLRSVLKGMKSALVELSPDIIMLQEIRGEHLKEAEAQFEYFADTLWPHHAYAKNAIYRAGHHGNAILSKYPIVEVENIQLTTRKRASRSLLHGLVELPRGLPRLHVICLHFALTEKSRKEQFLRLIERVDESVPHDEPLIVAGDFNDWRSRARNYFAERMDLTELIQVSEGRHARSFPSFFPLLPLDRIYFRGIEPAGGGCLRGQPWSKLSDHLPILGEFCL